MRFLIHVSTNWCGMDQTYRAGADCKKKIYEDHIKGKYNVQFVLEDNYKCVKMWREQGLLCLQPNEGKF